MNKREFVERVAAQLGDKRAAAAALDAVLDTIMAAVAGGEKVTITGWGSFERVQRPERQARNPATGATIIVPATAVPKFKPGADFKAAVAQYRPTAGA